jgi:dienelactone hydrolase
LEHSSSSEVRPVEYQCIGWHHAGDAGLIAADHCRLPVMWMHQVRILTLLLACALPGFSSGAEAQGFDPAKVGGPASGAPAELYLPAAMPPPAAVVVLHGCDGVGPHYRQWASRLADWGYAALLIDSFRPRGFSVICNHGELVPPEAQARDAFDGAAWLRNTQSVPANRVGVIGFSHGGWAVLKAVLGGLVRRPDEPPFAAAVAYYPGCDVRDPPAHRLETDTLILIGDADDWTPVERCTRWREAVRTAGHTLQMTVYPGARHGFDAPMGLHYYAGHYVGQDPAAFTASLTEVRNFFAEASDAVTVPFLAGCSRPLWAHPRAVPRRRPSRHGWETT